MARWISLYSGGQEGDDGDDEYSVWKKDKSLFLLDEPERLHIERFVREEEKAAAERILQLLLALLDDNEKVILKLHFVGGMKVADVAIALDRSPQAIYYHIRKIRSKAEALRNSDGV